MSKNEVFEKQAEIKRWLKKIGLSQSQFAELFYDEHHATSLKEEVDTYKEKFKKHLNRPSTKIELLESYLNFLFTTEKFREGGFFKPQSTSDDILNQEIMKLMKKVSKELTEKIS
ncbi:hypothetical protein DESUT3_21310 [Desulfuromonas versatilis]|uniref:Uncharacterized protein n=1 Tax=Desulfuromonas versatilis TaxID=2802975 RepID=A0ABN6DYW9_9BACT|nr:hypothetical protein [Desulfuromonas versatilis]BCR05062.1 hypothetical protein DESUT3_21310 [Desulfuromonas versatilis]